MKQKVQSILQSELSNIEKRISVLKQNDPFMDPDHVTDNAVDTDVREQEAHQRIEAELEELQERIAMIQIALKRVASGTYGTCKRCNKTIPSKRLELIPESLYCVSCEEKLKK